MPPNPAGMPVSEEPSKGTWTTERGCSTALKKSVKLPGPSGVSRLAAASSSEGLRSS
jgi:hypothetical protein